MLYAEEDRLEEGGPPPPGVCHWRRSSPRSGREARRPRWAPRRTVSPRRQQRVQRLHQDGQLTYGLPSELQSNSYYEMKHISISMRKQSNCCFQSCCLRGGKATVLFSLFIKRITHICLIVWTRVRRLFCHTKIEFASSWGTNHVSWCATAEPNTDLGSEEQQHFICLFPEWLYTWCGCTEFTHNAPFHLPLQDYPSLALLGEKLAENNIFLIFAVTKQLYIIYKVHPFTSKISTFSLLNPPLLIPC